MLLNCHPVCCTRCALLLYCTAGILADEMGLGKTLQSISILAYMRDFQNVSWASDPLAIRAG